MQSIAKPDLGQDMAGVASAKPVADRDKFRKTGHIGGILVEQSVNKSTRCTVLV